MNLTYFRPKMRGNVKNKNNNPTNIRFFDKTSEIYLGTSHLMSYYYIKSGNTGINDPELLVQSQGSRSRTAPLFRHKV